MEDFRLAFNLLFILNPKVQNGVKSKIKCITSEKSPILVINFNSIIKYKYS